MIALHPNRRRAGDSIRCFRGPRVHRPLARPSSAAFVQYTSGTTGRPKGVIFTHSNALWAAKVSATHEGLTASDVHLVYLPLFHINALGYSVLASLWAGASFVLQPRFSASRFWEVSVRHKCTWASQITFALNVLAAAEVPRIIFGCGVLESAVTRLRPTLACR